SSFSFDPSISQIMMAFNKGAILCVGRSPIFLTADNLGDFVAKYEITHVDLPPVVLNEVAKDYFGGVRTIIIGGSAASANLFNAWGRKSGRSIFNVYGPTESTVCTTIFIDDKRAEYAAPP